MSLATILQFEYGCDICTIDEFLPRHNFVVAGQIVFKRSRWLYALCMNKLTVIFKRDVVALQAVVFDFAEMFQCMNTCVER